MEVQRWVAAVVLCLVATTSFAVGWASRGGTGGGDARDAAPASEGTSTSTTAVSTTTASTTTTSTTTTRPAPGLVEDDDPTASSDEPAGPEAFTHTLTVHTDGCGVIRTEVDPEPQDLTWEVLDEDGFSVLGRNALGETRYRYFGGGTYTVTLTAWGGESSLPVSNTVTITC